MYQAYCIYYLPWIVCFLKNSHTHLSPRKKRVVNKITPLQEWPPKIPHANLLARPRGSSGVRPWICPLQPSQLDSSLGRPNKPSPRNPHAHWPTVEKQWHHGCLVDAQDLGNHENIFVRKSTRQDTFQCLKNTRSHQSAKSLQDQKCCCKRWKMEKGCPIFHQNLWFPLT